MWMDGILTDKPRRKRPNKSRGRRKSGPVTVSARARERNAEKRRRLVAVVLLVVVVVGFGVVIKIGLDRIVETLFTENDRYIIQTWDVASDGPVLSPALIREMANLRDPCNLFALNLRKVREELERAPAIRSAVVERRLPDTLVVRVSERLPVARLEQEMAIPFAVDEEGAVFVVRPLRSMLPLIRGVRVDGLSPGMVITEPLFTDALRFLELAGRPEASTLLRVLEIDAGQEDNLHVTLRSGENVIINRDFLPERVDELVSILSDQVRRGRVASVINMSEDIRIPPTARY
jgi:cell division protein FtsQ